MPAVLFVCTGNLCRSPSAQRLLAARTAGLGPDTLEVDSVGTVQAGGAPPAPLRDEALAFGISFEGHVPRRMTAPDVANADLVLGMARQHARDAVVLDPGAFSRIFTLREFVRRAEQVGPRQPDESFRQWRSGVHGDRRHLDLVGDSVADDIPDPIGGPPEGYRRMLTELSALIDALHALGWGASTATQPR
jgi:protein-tyrosine phosphatase